jgi:Flp pilus assembly protein TadD
MVIIVILALMVLGAAFFWWNRWHDREYSYAERAEVIEQALRDKMDLNFVYWSKTQRRFLQERVKPELLAGEVLQGYDRVRNVTRTFKVTRIKKIKLAPEPYDVNTPAPKQPVSAVLWVNIALGVIVVVFFAFIIRRMHTTPKGATNEVAVAEIPAGPSVREMLAQTSAPTGTVEPVIASIPTNRVSPDILSLDLDKLVAAPSGRSRSGDDTGPSDMTVERVEPTSSAGFIERGQTRLGERNYAGAISDFSRSIEINPYSPPAYLGRATARTYKGEFDKAIADATRAIELNPYLPAAFMTRGLALQRKGDLEKALADFNKAIELNPQDTAFYNGRAYAHYKKGDLESAYKDATAAIGIDRLNVQAYDTRGWVEFARGNTNDAVRDCRQGIDLSPDSISGKSCEGLLHFIQGDYPAAAIAWRRAIELGPDLKGEFDPWIKKAEDAAAAATSK